MAVLQPFKWTSQTFVLAAFAVQAPQAASALPEGLQRTVQVPAPLQATMLLQRSIQT
eukprot:CAMPEP_0185907142 /NCGR_PEP_ID=MMETSP0196C-20130402/6512_1 /TAXON_ID=2932 /ORGANISM="Alexandrium fundyense, Strain CCMP1719" /LENGTH=56 /DNA_ID=CAMNT_0028627043 /DNA_START=133 /DNA_END=300 /DNA_ORIENTATION=+